MVVAATLLSPCHGIVRRGTGAPKTPFATRRYPPSRSIATAFPPSWVKNFVSHAHKCHTNGDVRALNQQVPPSESVGPRAGALRRRNTGNSEHMWPPKHLSECLPAPDRSACVPALGESSSTNKTRATHNRRALSHGITGSSEFPGTTWEYAISMKVGSHPKHPPADTDIAAVIRLIPGGRFGDRRYAVK